MYCSECGTVAEGRYCASCGKPLKVLGAAYPPPQQEPESADAGPARTTGELWMGRFERAFSIRVGCLSLLLGLIVGVLVGLVWEPASVPVALTVWGLAWMGTVFNDAQVMKCEHCKKRVKLGASACHHCGRATA